MKNQFVIYKIALKLKEFGFDEPCLAYFTSEKEIKYTDSDLSIQAGQWLLPIPLWQQIIDWLDKKYNLLVVVKYDKTYGYQWDIRGKRNKPIYRCAVTYQRLYDARKIAILKAINILMKSKLKH
jgi:hypothetical protein